MMATRLLRAGQEKVFWRLWNDPEELLLIGHRRLGKTRLGAVLQVLALYYASGLLLHFYPQMRSTVLDDITSRWRRLNRSWRGTCFLPGEKQADGVLSVEIPAAIEAIYTYFPLLHQCPTIYTESKSRARLIVNDRNYIFNHTGIQRLAENKRGGGLEIAMIDEIADHNPYTLKSIVFPQLNDSRGFAFATGTAKANYSLQSIADEYFNAPGKDIIKITALDAIDMGDMTKADLDHIVNQRFGGDWNNPIFLQEYMCEWDLPVEGAVLRHWRPKIVSIPPDAPLFASVDVGFNDAYVVLVWAATTDGRIILADGVKYTETYTADIINDLKRRYGLDLNRMFETIYLPHDAFARRAMTRNTEASIWQQSGISKTIEQAAKLADVPAHIRQMLSLTPKVDIAGTFPDDLQIDLKNWRFKDGIDAPVHDQHSHTGDAFRYGVVSAFGLNNSIFSRPAVRNYLEPMDKFIAGLGGKRIDEMSDGDDAFIAW